MSWWDSQSGIIGDGPADAMGEALAKGFPNGLPSTRELIEGLAGALGTSGPTSIFNGKNLRFESVRLPRKAGAPLAADGKASDPVARAAFAAFLDSLRKDYRQRWKRPPRPSEITEALGFVVGAAPGRYVSDPDDHDFRNARIAYVDTRGTLLPAVTLSALVGFVRGDWEARFGAGTSLQEIRMRVGSGDVVIAEGKPDAAIVAEIGAALKQLVRDEIFKPTADRSVSAFERALRIALDMQPERFLGGADARLSELSFGVLDPRPRVRHEKFGEGRIVGESGAGAGAKLEIAFADRTCVLMASFVERL